MRVSAKIMATVVALLWGACLLNLSVYTVETHRTRILQKLNLHNVPELILYAVRKGIIS